MPSSLSGQNNQLTGTIPTQLGKLTKMTDDFGLSSNKLRGTIPTELGMLTKLCNDFQLQGNQLTGTIPDVLGKLTNLGAESEDLEANDSDFLLGGNDLVSYFSYWPLSRTSAVSCTLPLF